MIDERTVIMIIVAVLILSIILIYVSVYLFAMGSNNKERALALEESVENAESRIDEIMFPGGTGSYSPSKDVKKRMNSNHWY